MENKNIFVFISGLEGHGQGPGSMSGNKHPDDRVGKGAGGKRGGKKNT